MVRPMGADQDDGVFEPGVADAGHGHEKPPDEGLEVVHTHIIGARCGGRKARAVGEGVGKAYLNATYRPDTFQEPAP